MWTEPVTVVTKTLKLSVDGALKLCDLALDLGEFPSELAYGLPSGREQLLLLNQGHISQVTFTPDGDYYRLEAKYLTEQTMAVAHSKIMEVRLQSKQDKEGVITVEGKMVVRFMWSAEDLLFFAQNLSHEMQVTLIPEQLSLPHVEAKGGKATVRA